MTSRAAAISLAAASAYWGIKWAVAHHNGAKQGRVKPGRQPAALAAHARSIAIPLQGGCLQPEAKKAPAASAILRVAQAVQLVASLLSLALLCSFTAGERLIPSTNTASSALLLLLLLMALLAPAQLFHGQLRSLTRASAASGEALNAPEAPQLTPNPLLNGTWVKDAAQSESMDEAVRVMQLNGLVRTAIKLIRGLEVSIKDGEFHMAVFSVISWFKVRERYALTGELGQFKRRDLRAGKHTGHVAVQSDGSVKMSLTWGEPYGGQGEDLFELLDDNTLCVTSRIMLSSEPSRIVSYKTIYTRK